MEIGREQEVIYEFLPELPQLSRPAPAGAPGSLAGISPASRASGGVNSSSVPASEAFNAFVQKEAEAADAAASALGPRRRRAEYEDLGSSPQLRGFEPPEQRLARLRAEVTELLSVAEDCTEHGPDSAVGDDLFGEDPSAVVAELRVLEQRLGGLARDVIPAGQLQGGQAAGKAGALSVMSDSLVSQLERLAAGVSADASATRAATSPTGGDGRVVYEISYVPGTHAIADSSRIAALESSLADIERHMGVLDPSFPYADLQTAVTQLQRKVGLLDNQRLDGIRNGVQKVLSDMDAVLAKKAQLLGNTADQELDRKVSQLYDFCQRWTAAAASLPAVVSRLQSLQALHKQSASFASRLAALERQQDELNSLLEATSTAVEELGSGMKENMKIIIDNMRSLEQKMTKAIRT